MIFLINQAQRFCHFQIQLAVSGRAFDQGEITAVIPHGPADVVAAENFRHVGEPAAARAVAGDEFFVHAEFIAGERGVIFFRPRGGPGDFIFDALQVPAFRAVIEQKLARGRTFGLGR